MKHAQKLDSYQAYTLWIKLNESKDDLTKRGYAPFEVETIEMTPFEEASRDAVDRMDYKDIIYALSVMEENRCPLYMVGNGYAEGIINALNEWGEENGMEEDWYTEYGTEEEAFFLGYEILDTEHKYTMAT